MKSFFTEHFRWLLLGTGILNKTNFFERSAFFWVLIRIVPEGAYFLGFIVFEKLNYYARFEVCAIRLKAKTKNFA